MSDLTGRLARARVLIVGLCVVGGLCLGWAVGSCRGDEKKAQEVVLARSFERRGNGKTGGRCEERSDAAIP